MNINYTNIILIICFSMIAIIYILDFQNSLNRKNKRREKLMDFLGIKI